MIRAIVSSRSCFCWLYRAFPSLAAKNIIHLVSVLTVWWWPCGESSLGCLEKGGPICETPLALALHHFVLQGQSCLLFLVFLNFFLLHFNPLWSKGQLFVYLFGISSTRCCRSLQTHSISASLASVVGALLFSYSVVSLYDPMNCSTPGFTVLHHLLEHAQLHVHWVGDAIQSFHSLSSPTFPALDLSQHQGLFQWVDSSHQVAKYWNFSFIDWGIDLFYCDVKCFALEMNWDHSVFEVASKYCILGSFVDYEGCSISSKGFLPTVVGLMVI